MNYLLVESTQEILGSLSQLSTEESTELITDSTTKNLVFEKHQVKIENLLVLHL